MTTRSAKIVLSLLVGILLALIVWTALWGKILAPLSVVLISLWLVPFAAQRLGLPAANLKAYKPPPEFVRRAARAKKIGRTVFFASILSLCALIAGVMALGWTSLSLVLPIAVVGLLGVFVGLGYGMFATFVEYKGVRQNIREKKMREQAQK